MQRSWLFLLLLTGWRSAPEAQAQVVINEVCPKNATVLAEAPGHFPDWIELHNPGPIAVDLTGLRLSIDPEDPSGWSLPSGTLAPGGFLLLFEGDDNSDGHHFDFKLAREGAHLVLRKADLLPLSTLTVPYLRADHSFGLATATGSAYFPTPTPGAPNSTEGYAGYTTAPQFGRSPGFHAQGLAVNILSGPGTSVRFTTDGSEPGLDAQPYTGPVGIGGNTTLKAKAFQEGYIPSTTTVGTYFVGENSALPVVSLSVHPDSLFHPVLGLYMPGPGASPDYPYHGANFWTERGIAVHFEYFDEHGARRVQQELELRIHGGSASRTKPQRPFRLTARDVYGDDRIRHAFFPDRPEHEVFKRIILRNAGGDWCLAHYRDAFFHQVALHEGLDVDGLGFRSVLVFINGEYRGIHEIRERIDEDHLALTQGADPDSVLIMEEENGSIQGDTMHFHNLKEFIHTHDLNDEAHYAHVDSLLDVPGFMDYFALEMFAGNADWPANNLKYWKPSVTEGKWRYLLYDLDATMAAAGWITNDFDMFHYVLVHRAGLVHPEIFRSLMERMEFRRGFLNRLADLMNTALSTPSLHRENDAIRATLGPEIERHYNRWGFPADQWEEHSGALIPAFIEQRAHFMREDVLQWYDLPNTATLDFTVYPPAAGGLQINTIRPALPFEGVYFNGNDIDVTAEAAEGWVFDHWTYDTTAVERSEGRHLRRSFASDGILTAHFLPENGAFVVFPDPCTDELNIVPPGGASGPMELLVHDIQGRLVLRRMLTDLTLPPGPLDVSGLVPGTFLITARQNGAARHARFVRMRP